MLHPVLTVAASAALFAVSVAGIIELFSTSGRHTPAQTGRRRRVLAWVALHLLAAASGVYLCVAVPIFRTLFPLWCWLYLGYLTFGSHWWRHKE